jgi:hypothetical protein
VLFTPPEDTPVTTTRIVRTAADLAAALTDPDARVRLPGGHTGTLESVQRESGGGRQFNVTVRPDDGPAATHYVRFNA